MLNVRILKYLYIYRHLKCVKWLVLKQADMELKNKEGKDVKFLTTEALEKKDKVSTKNTGKTPGNGDGMKTSGGHKLFIEEKRDKKSMKRATRAVERLKEVVDALKAPDPERSGWGKEFEIH